MASPNLATTVAADLHRPFSSSSVVPSHEIDQFSLLQARCCLLLMPSSTTATVFSSLVHSHCLSKKFDKGCDPVTVMDRGLGITNPLTGQNPMDALYDAGSANAQQKLDKDTYLQRQLLGSKYQERVSSGSEYSTAYTQSCIEIFPNCNGKLERTGCFSTSKHKRQRGGREMLEEHVLNQAEELRQLKDLLKKRTRRAFTTRGKNETMDVGNEERRES